MTDPIREQAKEMLAALKAREEEEEAREPGYRVLTLIFFLPLIFWQAWSYALVWGWYCASFSLPPITWHQAAGFAVLWSMVFMKRPGKDATAQDLVGWQFIQAFSILLGIFTAYLFRP